MMAAPGFQVIILHHMKWRITAFVIIVNLLYPLLLLLVAVFFSLLFCFPLMTSLTFLSILLCLLSIRFLCSYLLVNVFFGGSFSCADHHHVSCVQTVRQICTIGRCKIELNKSTAISCTWDTESSDCKSKELCYTTMTKCELFLFNSWFNYR